MVRYFLLRDNDETGPYTLAELKGKTLYTTDLIWVDGESTCWKSPGEIDGFQNIGLATKKRAPKNTKPLSTNGIQASLHDTASASLSFAGGETTNEFLPPGDYTPPSFEALKEKYAQKPPQKKVWKRQVNIGANLMGLITLFIGLGLSAYMIKKAVENMDFEPVIASATAHEISPEKMPESNTTHAAFASMVPVPEKNTLVPDTSNASLPKAESRLAADSVQQQFLGEQKKAAVHTARQEDGSAHTETAKATNQQETIDTTKETTEETTPEAAENETATEKNAEEKKPAAKPSLQLAANKYNVGFLGGISNLEISVSNPSEQEVRKAVVEVEFLRPNGKVVGTQTVTVSGIAPGSSKSVAVPDHNRGVSVRYKVVNTER